MYRYMSLFPSFYCITFEVCNHLWSELYLLALIYIKAKFAAAPRGFQNLLLKS